MTDVMLLVKYSMVSLWIRIFFLGMEKKLKIKQVCHVSWHGEVVRIG